MKVIVFIWIDVLTTKTLTWVLSHDYNKGQLIFAVRNRAGINKDDLKG